MGRWKMVRLGDVCEKDSSNIAQKDLENNFGDYPIYGAAGLIKYVDFYKQLDEYIAIVKDGAGIGRTILMPAKSSVIGTMQYILPTNAVDTKYLFFAITHMNLAKYFTGATIPHIYFKDYCKEQLPLPPLDEQKRIAKNLDLASEIVKGYKEQLSELDKLVQSVFYEMFGDPVTNEKGWDISVLSNHLDVIGGYAFKSEGFLEDGIPILRIGNINSGQFKSANLVFWKKDDKLKKYMVYPGDLVISLTGTVGKEDYGNICVIGHEYNCYYLNQRNARLKLKWQLNTYYLSFLLKAPQIKGKLTGISRGVRQANISNSDILHLAVPVPPSDLQTRFASIVTEIEAHKEQVKQALTEAENLFHSLMQEYFE